MFVVAGRDMNFFEMIAKNNLEMIKRAISGGADVNSVNKYGETPILIAAFQGQTELVRRLIDAGANVNIADRDNETPLRTAARMGHTEIAKILIANGADLEAEKKDGWTPLYLSVYHGHCEIMQMLIAAGADIKARGRYGGSVLDAVTHTGRPEEQVYNAKWLILSGAEIHSTNNFGQSPSTVAKDYYPIKQFLEEIETTGVSNKLIEQWIIDDWELIKAIGNPTRSQVLLAKISAHGKAGWSEFENTEKIRAIMGTKRKEKETNDFSIN